MIDGPPKIVALTIDLHEDLVDMPLPSRKSAQLLNTTPTDLEGKHWAKPVPPEPDGFMAHIAAAFMQQIFDISER